MLKALLILLLAAPTAPAPAESAESSGMAVLDLVLKGGVDKNVGDMLNEIILARLNESGKFGTVLGGSDIKDLLTLEEQKTALGCEDDSCLAQLGGALGVPYLFTSSLGTFGGKFILTLKLTSVDEAVVLARRSEIIQNDAALLEKLPQLISDMVEETMAKKAEAAAAEAGTAPKSSTASAEPPKTKPKTKAAASAKTTPVPAKESTAAPTTSKSKRPLYKKPMAWTGLGLLFAAGAVGIGMNQPELGSLEDYGQSYQLSDPASGQNDPLTWEEFNAAVVNRQWTNIAGTSLGGLGLGLIIYSIGWGS